jgi:hypothetical protein
MRIGSALITFGVEAVIRKRIGGSAGGGTTGRDAPRFVDARYHASDQAGDGGVA